MTEKKIMCDKISMAPEMFVHNSTMKVEIRALTQKRSSINRQKNQSTQSICQELYSCMMAFVICHFQFWKTGF